MIFPKGPGRDDEALGRQPRGEPKRTRRRVLSHEELNSVGRYLAEIDLLPEEVVIGPKTLKRFERQFRRMHEGFTPWRQAVTTPQRRPPQASGSVARSSVKPDGSPVRGSISALKPGPPAGFPGGSRPTASCSGTPIRIRVDRAGRRWSAS